MEWYNFSEPMYNLLIFCLNNLAKNLIFQDIKKTCMAIKEIGIHLLFVDAFNGKTMTFVEA